MRCLLLSAAFKAEVSKHNAILNYRNLCQDLHATSHLFEFPPHLRTQNYFAIIIELIPNIDCNFGVIFTFEIS